MSRTEVTTTVADFFRRVWQWVGRHPLWTAAAAPALVIIYVLALIPFTPSIKDIQKLKIEQPTIVLSSDGKELAVFKRANRDWVKLADISPNVLAALIATEDRRFFDHHGFDVRRTVVAAWRTALGDLQGGSTITQQLARNLFPEEIGRATTMTRKIKEAITAFKIEAVYTKNEILETYLNTVPFLYNAYGIEMAARTYYDKSARALDVLESATLIGMLKGTSYYNPVLNPERSRERRNTVLAQMVRDSRLNAANFEVLRKLPLKLDFERQTEPIGPAPHVAQQLRRWLIDWADRNGYNMHADGLVVHTTIDSRLQNFANEALTRQADKLQAIADSTWGRRTGWSRNKDMAHAFVRESEPYRQARASRFTDDEALKKLLADADFMETLWTGKTHLQAGFMALDPANGHVRAWVGSRDFNEEKFDHVHQARRQPGSTFKPFVYGAAFDQGVSPNESLMDQEVEIRLDDRTVWRPTDVGGPSGQPMTLRDGLVRSKNTITAQLMQRIGPSRVAKVAQDMGVRYSKLDPVPSLALGTSPVTLREMVSAFGTIANGGNYVEPVLVTRVEDRHHRVLASFQPKPSEHALSHEAAQTLLDVMRGVIERGTGVGIRSRFGIQADVAGKTGTTQDNTDGWFIMMHPQLVAGAWVGFNDNRVTMRGDWGQGAHNALNIVGDFYQQSFKSRTLDPNQKFTAPRQQNAADPLMGRVNDWLSGLFQNEPQAPEMSQPVSMPELPAIIEPPRSPSPLPEVAVREPLPVTLPQALPAPERPVLPEYVPRPVAPIESGAPQARVLRRADPNTRIVIIPSTPAPATREANTAPLEPPADVQRDRPVLTPRGSDSSGPIQVMPKAAERPATDSDGDSQ